MKKYALIIFAFLTIQDVSALSLWDNVLLRTFPKTLFFRAVRSENEEAIKRCIGKVDFNELDDDGLGLVHRMAQSRKLGSLKLLVKYGADINIKGDAEFRKEFTALHDAARGGDIVLVRALIDLGANIKASTKYGITPFNLANECQNRNEGHAEICNLLIEKGAYVFLEAVRCGDIKAITNFLKTEDVNVKTLGGKTPLHIAAMKGYDDVVKLLLVHGAHVNACDHCGSSPIHDAVTFNRISTLSILIEKGADLLLVSEGGLTLLHNAVLFGRFEIIKILIEMGMPVNIKTTAGTTPFALSLNGWVKDQAKIIEYLLKAGGGI